MKKITILVVLAALCLFCGAQAQNKNILKPLKVGDQLPDILLTGLLHSAKPSLNTSDFRDKWLIIDFWATWCSPCVAMVPRIDTLQEQFASSLRFLPVTYQKRPEIEKFEASFSHKFKKQLSLTEAVEDTILHQLFPHSTVPHYVWINPMGRVVAITEFDQINPTKIRQVIAGNADIVVQKKPNIRIPYDVHLPLLIAGNGGKGDNLIYHSTLTSYTQGLGTGYSMFIDTAKGAKITGRNQAIFGLYRLAYSDLGQFNTLNTRLTVRDTTKVINDKDFGQKYREWLSNGNGFCYELLLPKELASSARKIMRNDLELLFPKYKAQIEHNDRECFILEKTAPIDATMHTKGGKADIIIDSFQWKVVNTTLEILAERLNEYTVMPLKVIDETGIKDSVDVKIPITTKKLQLVELNEQLARYHLKLTKQIRKLEELVISDRH
jgi:thiol-disulfide isomerase/thioredoxin